MAKKHDVSVGTPVLFRWKEKDLSGMSGTVFVRDRHKKSLLEIPLLINDPLRFTIPKTQNASSYEVVLTDPENQQYRVLEGRIV